MGSRVFFFLVMTGIEHLNMAINFFYNHQEFIEKAIKLIVKAKYRNMTKKMNRLRKIK